MAKFDFKCPQCGETIEADDSFRGQVAECPSCGKGIVVPRKLPPSEKKVQLHPVRREVPSIQPHQEAKGAVSRHGDVSGRHDMAQKNRPAVPEYVGGYHQRNVSEKRDSFNQ